jgi:hypothetical protein
MENIEQIIKICKIHIVCFDCPFKLGLRGHFQNKGICQYNKRRAVHNSYNRLHRLSVNAKRY